MNSWDTLLIHILISKLDSVSRRAWEAQNSSNVLPTFRVFKEFLQEKCRLLEAISQSSSKSIRGGKKNTYNSVTALKCSLCQNEHFIYNCKDFIKLDGNGRLSEAIRLKLCLNCLRKGHLSKDCICQIDC